MNKFLKWFYFLAAIYFLIARDFSTAIIMFMACSISSLDEKVDVLTKLVSKP